MHRKKHEEKCEEGCDRFERERNHYFTGKYMNKRDFQVEQDYFRSRHQWHNRLMHGWGIVCGLRVMPHRSADCRDAWVIVTPGVAIDCCGREIVLEEETPIRIWQPPDPPKDDPEQQSGGYEKDIEPQKKKPKGKKAAESFLLNLHYCEERIEYVPVLHGEGECDPKRREPNRIREGACLVVCDPDDLGRDCWRGKGKKKTKKRCLDDCGDKGPTGSCLDHDCPCDEYVPLALIRPRYYDDTGYVINKKAINMKGRRTLRTPPEFLTHITRINWPHGGVMTLSELRRKKGRLQVTFDRKLEPAKGYKTGVNPRTFVVQYQQADLDLEFVPPETGDDDDWVNPKVKGGCRAVFTIDRNILGGEGRRQRHYQSLEGAIVYVTLECDFILDCHGNAVDGDHLKGALPTGNGIEGGTFKSWFRVVNDNWNKREVYDVGA